MWHSFSKYRSGWIRWTNSEPTFNNINYATLKRKVTFSYLSTVSQQNEKVDTTNGCYLGYNSYSTIGVYLSKYDTIWQYDNLFFIIHPTQGFEGEISEYFPGGDTETVVRYFPQLMNSLNHLSWKLVIFSDCLFSVCLSVCL